MKGITLWWVIFSTVLGMSLVKNGGVSGDSCGILSGETELIGRPLFEKTKSIPWMASYGRLLTYENGTQGWDNICGASIIGRDTVLTAAYCLHKIGRQWVRVGLTDLNTPINNSTNIFRVKTGIVHPKYKYPGYPDSSYDVAVLKLAQNISYNDLIQPVCLPSNSDYLREFQNKSTLLTGWSLKETENYHKHKSRLQGLNLRFFGESFCVEVPFNATEKYPGEEKIVFDGGKTMCSGNDKIEVDTCKGISGSPVVWHDKSTNQDVYTQIGVVNGAKKLCLGIYTGLGFSEVSTFINEVLEGRYLTKEEQLEVDMALWTASKHGDLNMMKAALRKGADLEYEGSPIIMAARYGHLPAVQFLLDEGAEINGQSSHGFTTLSYAAVPGDDDIVRLLLRLGSDVNSVNDFGRTPLMYAAIHGRASTVRILLEAGATVDATDYWGDTALSLTRKENHQDVIEILQEWKQNHK